ncbi:MAG: Major facilitator superfamily [Parcubacteria bacterium C7867-005]|nr:MAG: Major facilitator superfamily [Parcubacteria bacterium C7867-005]
MSKKPLFLWSLYDFANSIVLMAFLFYFSQWLVIDQGKPAWWYNAALIVSSTLFIITAPLVSKKIDATKVKIKGLRFWTLLTFAGYTGVSLLVMFSDSLEVFATILYTLSTYAYLVCFLYFTPMLNDLSSQENRSWRSGIGQSANSIGQVVGILITLPFVNGVTLFGDPGRAQALFPATIIFGLLALPMLLFYRENANSVIDIPLAKGQSNPVSLFREVFSCKPLALLLLAYFLFSDAMLTFANNFPLYLETVHHATDTVKSLLTASILILAAIGAIIFGKIADKKGNLKTLKIILVVWCFIFMAMVLVTNFKTLIPIFLFAGILFGPVWGISRALVGELAPPHLVASSYSYYVVAERFATFVGPAVWSIALITMGEGVRGYQTGLISLTLLLIISLFVLNRIKIEKSVIAGSHLT